MKPIGIFGGTFDPVHFGHLRVVLEIVEQFDLQELRLIPCGTPPIKETATATATQRLEMLRLALGKTSGKTINTITVDDIETQRDGRSYTVNTLTEIKEKTPGTPIYLILGADAFSGLDHWHQWRDIFTLAHIIIIHRPGWDINAAESVKNMSSELKSTLDSRLINDKSALHPAQAGNIIMFPIRKLDISSSSIRELIKTGKSPQYLLPQDVLRYIESKKLYS